MYVSYFHPIFQLINWPKNYEAIFPQIEKGLRRKLASAKKCKQMNKLKDLKNEMQFQLIFKSQRLQNFENSQIINQSSFVLDLNNK